MWKAWLLIRLVCDSWVVSWCATRESWRVTRDFWCVIRESESWRVTYDLWVLVRDSWNGVLARDSWRLASLGAWVVTRDAWILARELWLVSGESWRVTRKLESWRVTRDLEVLVRDTWLWKSWRVTRVSLCIWFATPHVPNNLTLLFLTKGSYRVCIKVIQSKENANLTYEPYTKT